MFGVGVGVLAPPRLFSARATETCIPSTLETPPRLLLLCIGLPLPALPFLRVHLRPMYSPTKTLFRDRLRCEGRVVADGAQEHRRLERQRVHVGLPGAVLRPESHRGGGRFGAHQHAIR